MTAAAGPSGPISSGTLWGEAFPQWELVEDNVPVGAQQHIRDASPENRTETILEIAAAFPSVSDFSLGELYPYVPAKFPFRLDAADLTTKTTTFAAIAALPAVDVFPVGSRVASRAVHRTLAQANAAAAAHGVTGWPQDEILGTISSALFSLYPTQYYALVDVAICGRDRHEAESYAARDLGVADLDEFAREAAAAAFAVATTPTVVDWLAGIHNATGPLTPDDLADSHPQLLRKLPLSQLTLIETIAAFDPGLALDAGAFVRVPPHSAPVGLSSGDKEVLDYIASHPEADVRALATHLGRPFEEIFRQLRTLSAIELTPTFPDLPDVPTIDEHPEPTDAEAETETEESSSGPSGAAATETGTDGPPGETPSVEGPVQVEKAPRDDSVSDAMALADDATIDQWEEQLRTKLDGAYLAADVDLSPRELDRLLDLYAARYQLARNRGTTVNQIVRLYPASTLMSLVGMASVGLENNTYWSAFWERLGVEPNAHDENALRQQIRALLADFGMDPVKGLASDRHVQRLAIHAGIPAASFDKLLDALTSYVALVDNQEDRPFSDWILEPSHEILFHQIDFPTRNFVEFSGSRGREILAGLASIVASAAENPGSAETSVDASTTSLPELIRLALKDAFARADIGEEVRARRRRSKQVPTIYLGADDRVVVRLPAPVSHSSAQWAVTIDSDVRHVMPDRFARDQPVDVPIDKPARRVVVSHPSYNDPIEMRLFDPRCPLIAFTADGSHVPVSERLRRGELVVLHPVDLTVKGEGRLAPHVVGGWGSPTGWDGWQIHQWDLSETDAVRVQYGAHSPVDLTVGKRELPYLYENDDHPLETLAGVFHESLPVFGARPFIALPPISSTDAVPWTVKYRRSGAYEWTVQGTHSSTDLVAWELFEGQPELLGRFDISVTGPDGARFDHSVFVAEGLQVEYDDDVRIPEGDGLSEFGATLTSTSDTLRISEERLDFDVATATRTVRLTNGRASSTLTVRPPRVEFRLTPVGALPAWSDRMIGIRPEAISGATLAVKGVPGHVRLEAVVKDPHGRIQSRISLTEITRGDIRKVSADRLAPAAKSAQTGELVLLMHYPTEGTWEAPLARFSTVGTRVRVAVEENDLLISGLATTDDVVVHIWQIARPWKAPLSVPVVDGRAEIPASALEAGPLRVTPVVEDNWDPLPADPFPSKSSVLIHRPGEFGDSPSSGLSRYLAGDTPFPNVEVTNPKLWHALALLSRTLDDRHTVQFRQLSDHICRRPRDAAMSLASSSLDTPDKLSLYIRSGLVLESLDVSLPGTRRGDLTAEPWLDMLVAIADLRRADSTLREWLIRRVAEIGGSSLVAILASGDDPLREKAVIDKQAVTLSGNPELLRELLASFKIVPGGLVDDASRFDGYFSLFKLQHDVDDRLLTELYTVVMTRSRVMGAVRRYPDLWKNIEARSDPLQGLDPTNYAWASATFVSLTLALYARLVAIGLVRGQRQPALLEAWANFAHSEPVQSMIDLVIAEALVRHHRYPTIMSSPWKSNEQWLDAVIRTGETNNQTIDTEGPR